MPTLETFIASSSAAAAETLLAVCHSTRLAAAVAARRRSFAGGNFLALAAAAAEEWALLTEADWREAFLGHPRIGGNRDAAKARERSAWAKEESAGVIGAHAETLDALQRENDAYFEKFGFVFLVCATGKSAAEMLALLRARIGNSREAEVRNAAAEEAKITQIRLAKLFPAEAKAATTAAAAVASTASSSAL